MGRPVVLSNNKLFVGLDERGLVHDFYYPYVGQDNLTTSRVVPHKIGVWVEGKFSWLSDSEWDTSVMFEENVLVSKVVAINKRLAVTVTFSDAVDHEVSAFMRRIEVTNNLDKPRNIKLFLHQIFEISRSGRGDTAFYEPSGNYIFDYKGSTSLIIYAQSNGKPFSEFAVGNYGIEGKSGTFIDAEDGNLSGNLVEHGGVDSVVGLELELEPDSSQVVEYWIAAGSDQQRADETHQILLSSGLDVRLDDTRLAHKAWLQPAIDATVNIKDNSVKNDIYKSLLVLKSHIDNDGAIIASCDSSIYNYGRDYYVYCWPRDGSFVLWPLIKLGYKEEPLAFFDFCERVMHPDGYLQHKFQPDGSYGSTWHPLVQHHHKELAIQEDETAIVLFMIAEYVEKNNDYVYFRKKLANFIKPMTDFLAFYLDKETGLPHPSYDLWEQKFQTSTYTTFVVAATLSRIIRIAESLNIEQAHIAMWKNALASINKNVNLLYDEDKRYFIKGIFKTEGVDEVDSTLDVSSLYGAFMFGDNKNSEMIQSTVKKIEEILENATPNGGIPRYLYDNYLQVNNKLPGNPWFVCTFWMAQYYYKIGNKDRALDLIEWSKKRFLPSGVMSEQINPEDSTQAGVAPLLWSHAEYINTLLELHK